MAKYNTIYSYIDTIGETGKHDVSPFGLTTYDIYKKFTERIEFERGKPKQKRLTKEQKPKWKKTYAAYVRHGMKINQAKRKASWEVRYGTTEGWRGFHPQEVYDDLPLWKMHNWFIHLLEFEWKWVGVVIAADKDELNVEFVSQYSSRNRRFAWQMTALDGTIIHMIIYEKGQILKSTMWDAFNEERFMEQIEDLEVWE